MWEFCRTLTRPAWHFYEHNARNALIRSASRNSVCTMSDSIEPGREYLTAYIRKSVFPDGVNVNDWLHANKFTDDLFSWAHIISIVTTAASKSNKLRSEKIDSEIHRKEMTKRKKKNTIHSISSVFFSCQIHSECDLMMQSIDKDVNDISFLLVTTHKRVWK